MDKVASAGKLALQQRLAQGKDCQKGWGKKRIASGSEPMKAQGPLQHWDQTGGLPVRIYQDLIRGPQR